MSKLENLTKDEILEKIGNGEIDFVFMRNNFEDCVIKLSKGRSYMKYKGHKEMETDFDDDIFYDIFLDGDFITEEEYIKY